MDVFYHLVYEFQKSLRDLCLFTCSNEFKEKITGMLSKQGISYLIYNLDNAKMNVFFGMPECLEILRQFSSEELNKLSVEEDFILGMMLGYGKTQQYQRFLSRKNIA